MANHVPNFGRLKISLERKIDVDKTEKSNSSELMSLP